MWRRMVLIATIVIGLYMGLGANANADDKLASARDDLRRTIEDLRERYPDAKSQVVFQKSKVPTDNGWIQFSLIADRWAELSQNPFKVDLRSFETLKSSDPETTEKSTLRLARLGLAETEFIKAATDRLEPCKVIAPVPVGGPDDAGADDAGPLVSRVLAVINCLCSRAVAKRLVGDSIESVQEAILLSYRISMKIDLGIHLQGRADTVLLRSTTVTRLLSLCEQLGDHRAAVLERMLEIVPTFFSPCDTWMGECALVMDQASRLSALSNDDLVADYQKNSKHAFSSATEMIQVIRRVLIDMTKLVDSVGSSATALMNLDKASALVKYIESIVRKEGGADLAEAHVATNALNLINFVFLESTIFLILRIRLFEAKNDRWLNKAEIETLLEDYLGIKVETTERRLTISIRATHPFLRLRSEADVLGFPIVLDRWAN